MRLLGLLLVLYVPFLTCAEPLKTVYWFYSEMPPAYIQQGEHNNTGYADQTMQLLMDRLTNYHHVKVPANYKRSLNEIKEHENVCHAALLKTPDREAFVIYSEPAYVLGSNQLFVRKGNDTQLAGYLSADGSVDLEGLLANERFMLGVSSGAKYGESIDEILNLSSSQDNLVFRSAIDHYSGLSAMLKKSTRLDGFLGLPIENKFHKQPNSSLANELMSYPISGSDEYLLGYVGCSNSHLGRQVINAVNDVVVAERKKKISGFYQSWLLEDDVISHQNAVDSRF